MNIKTVTYISITALILGGAIASIVNKQGRVTNIKMGVGDSTSISYLFGKNFAETVNKYSSKVRIELVATEGSLKNIQLLEQDRVQLATAQSDIINSPSVRLIAYLFADEFQLVVTEKSGIKQVSDLKGKRIALMPIGSAHYKNFWILAAHYGLKKSEIKYRVMSGDAAKLAFSRNEVDAIFRNRVLGSKDIRELVQDYRGQLIPIEQGEAMRIDRPALKASIIPQGAYQGNPPIPPQDLSTVGIERNLMARSSLSPEIVREITNIRPLA